MGENDYSPHMNEVGAARAFELYRALSDLAFARGVEATPFIERMRANLTRAAEYRAEINRAIIREIGNDH